MCDSSWAAGSDLYNLSGSSHKAALGVGTCGNEVLHAETRGAFRQVYRIQRTGLEQKLSLSVFGKQIGHDAALRSPSLPQMHPRRALAQVLGRELLSQEEWRSLIHISEPTRIRRISYAVFCLKKKII